MTSTTDLKMGDGELRECPVIPPMFDIGDIVEIGGEYAGDWRGTYHYVAEITWNRKRDKLLYGTYQIDTNDGMTTDWEECHLVLVKKRKAMTNSCNSSGRV